MKQSKTSMYLVMKALHDDKTLSLFQAIQSNGQAYHTDKLMIDMKLSRKMFYGRMQNLLKAGLVRREKGIYHLTSMGKVVSHAENIIMSAVAESYKFGAIEAIIESDLPKHEQKKIIDNILTNPILKRILEGGSPQ